MAVAKGIAAGSFVANLTSKRQLFFASLQFILGILKGQ
jgi:hypothetical protein